MDKPSPVKMGLLLLGSFCIAHAGASLLHELGHTGAAILTGGHSRGIMIHPFNFSYSYSNSMNHPLIHTAAGALGSSLIALVLFMILIRRPRPVLMPLLMIGPVSFMDNGMYWAWDIITGAGCDACNLAQGGISPWLLVFAGIGLCLIGIIMVIYLIRVIGFANEPFRNRLVILSIGVGIYSLAGIFWNWYSGMEILWYSGIVFVFVFAWICGYFKTQQSIQYDIKWPIVTSQVIMGLVIVVTLLAIDTSPKTVFPSALIKTTTTRPNDFPDVLLPLNSAVEPYYITAGPVHYKRSYTLGYSLPKESNPEKMQNELIALCQDHGYVQLDYDLSEPDKRLDKNWKEERFQVGFKTVNFRHCTQQWIRLAPEVGYLRTNLNYRYKENAIQDVGVFMMVANMSELNEVLTYVDMHPKGFDLFEVEQLRIKALFGFNTSQPPVIMGQ